MRSLVVSLLLICFFWIEWNLCQQVREENPVVVKPAMVIARLATGAVDAATADTFVATNLSQQARPWMGISFISILVLFLSRLYWKGFLAGETAYASWRR